MATDSIDRGTAYRETRQRIVGLVRHLDDDAARAAVPACPAWTVRDIVAHVTGVCDDILAGRLDGVATDPWTQAQVDRRVDRSVAEICDEWDELAPKVEAILGGFGAAGSQLVFDCVTHEHDIRGALRAPGARDSDAVRIGVEFGVLGLQNALKERALPPLQIVSDEVSYGDSGGARLHAGPFDVLRSCSGRRSAEQIRGLSWHDGDPDVYLAAFTFGPFRLPDQPVVD